MFELFGLWVWDLAGLVDQDGVLVGLAYIEKVLTTLDEIARYWAMVVEFAGGCPDGPEKNCKFHCIQSGV